MGTGQHFEFSMVYISPFGYHYFQQATHNEVAHAGKEETEGTNYCRQHEYTWNNGSVVA